MEWRDHIRSDTKILSSKPMVRGTRLSVEFLLRLFAAGWTEEHVLDNYPSLKREDLLGVFTFAAVAEREREIPIVR